MGEISRLNLSEGRQMKFVSEHIDKACNALVGHTNWSFADEIIPSDTIQCGVGENVEHVIVIFKDPIEKEDK